MTDTATASDPQEILGRIGKHWAKGKHWAEGYDGTYGFWLPAEDATAIVEAFAELQLALNPLKAMR
jgi:hypothetical protein